MIRFWSLSNPIESENGPSSMGNHLFLEIKFLNIFWMRIMIKIYLHLHSFIEFNTLNFGYSTEQNKSIYFLVRTKSGLDLNQNENKTKPAQLNKI